MIKYIHDMKNLSSANDQMSSKAAGVVPATTDWRNTGTSLPLTNSSMETSSPILFPTHCIHKDSLDCCKKNLKIKRLLYETDDKELDKPRFRGNPVTHFSSHSHTSIDAKNCLSYHHFN